MTDTRKDSIMGIMWPIAVIIMAIAVIFMAYQNYQLRKEILRLKSRPYPADHIPSVHEGDTARPFMGQLSDGREIYFHPDSLVNPVIMVWFSYDCEPCLDALHRWNQLARKYPDQIIGIETGEWYDGALFSSNDAVFPVLFPASDSVKEHYQVYSTPQTMVVLPEGIIGYVKHGILDENAAAEIKAILNSDK